MSQVLAAGATANLDPITIEVIGAAMASATEVPRRVVRSRDDDPGA